jgi:hypothetical protein
LRSRASRDLRLKEGLTPGSQRRIAILEFWAAPIENAPDGFGAELSAPNFRDAGRQRVDPACSDHRERAN